jgi:hypothetical protein
MRAAYLALAGALVLGIVAGSAAPVSANEAGDSTNGGCGFDTNEHPTLTGGQNVGVIYDRSATTDPAHAPTGATVECWIMVNGVKVDSTDLVASGFGVQANAKQISFPAGDADAVEVCETVTYADGTTEPPCYDGRCPGAELCPILPQWVLDLLNLPNDLVIQYVDPAVCPELVKLAGTYGPITVTADGDVYVPDPLALFGGPIYDCPPYGNF